MSGAFLMSRVPGEFRVNRAAKIFFRGIFYFTYIYGDKLYRKQIYRRRSLNLFISFTKNILLWDFFR